MGETRRVLKFYGVWQDEREEAWLSRMAGEGWHLERAFIGCYTFRRGQPREMAYRLDYRLLKGKERSDYFQLFRDAGWEYVDTLANWHYFRTPATDGELPEIYTDPASRIDKYRRVMWILVLILAMNVCIITGRLPEQTPWFLSWIRLLQAGAVLVLGYAVLRILARIGQIKRQSRVE
jgi:hypothetical protein